MLTAICPNPIHLFWHWKKAPQMRCLKTGEEGFEPPWTVLETGILPLYDSPLSFFFLIWQKADTFVFASYPFKTAHWKCLPSSTFFHSYQPSGHALDRLVTVSSMHCCTSTSALSTSSSSRGLTTLQYGRSHLEGGFTLRCLQRLSLPNLATLPCTW